MVWHWVSLIMSLGTLGCIVLGVLLASLSFLSDCGLCSVTSPSSLGILFASLVTMPHADLLSLDLGRLKGACVGSVLMSRGTVVRGGVTCQW